MSVITLFLAIVLSQSHAEKLHRGNEGGECQKMVASSGTQVKPSLGSGIMFAVRPFITAVLSKLGSLDL